jgi:hypothetical protein
VVAVPVNSFLQFAVLTQIFAVTGLDRPETDAIPAVALVPALGAAAPAPTHAIVMIAATERTTTRQRVHQVFVSSTFFCHDAVKNFTC